MILDWGMSAKNCWLFFGDVLSNDTCHDLAWLIHDSALDERYSEMGLLQTPDSGHLAESHWDPKNTDLKCFMLQSRKCCCAMVQNVLKKLETSIQEIRSILWLHYYPRLMAVTP